MEKAYFRKFKLILSLLIIFGISFYCKESSFNPFLSDSDLPYSGEKVDVGLYIDSGVWDQT